MIDHRSHAFMPLSAVQIRDFTYSQPTTLFPPDHGATGGLWHTKLTTNGKLKKK